jgi:hypothetical protein
MLDPSEKESYTNGSTTIQDMTDYGHNGTLVNGPTFSPEHGGVLVFDGTNQYVNGVHTADLDLTGDVTIEVWFSVTTLSSDWVRLIGKSAEPGGQRTYGLWYRDTFDYLLYQRYGPSRIDVEYTLSSQLELGRWYHLVGTSLGSQHKLFLDNVLLASVTSTATPFATTGPYTLGYGNVHTYHNGQIGLARIYNRGLSQYEVSQNYNTSRQYYQNYSIETYPNLWPTVTLDPADQYTWDLLFSTTTPTRDASDLIVYDTINLTSLIGTTFDRVGVFMQNRMNNGTKMYWIFVSYDAFTTDVSKLMVPDAGNAFTLKVDVTNLRVYSNHPQVGTYATANGRLEIWPSNYGNSGSIGYAYNDGGFNTSMGYGSFQIHDMDALKTLLAWNRWNYIYTTNDIGIGNNDVTNIHYVSTNGAHPDWTFAQTDAYDWKLSVSLASQYLYYATLLKDQTFLQADMLGVTAASLTTWDDFTASSALTVTTDGPVPFISFDRSLSQYMDGGSQTIQVSLGFTVMCVVRFTNPGNYERIIDFGSGAYNNNIIFSRSATDTAMYLGIVEGSTYNTNHFVIGSMIDENAWVVVTGVYSASDMKMHIYKNGNLVASKDAPLAFSDRTVTNTYVGESHFTTSAFFEGDMKYIGCWEQALSAADVGHMYTYFKTKYGLEGFGVLDSIQNLYSQAVGAYSLRKLFRQYDGPQLRIRRSSDDAEADIWFTHKGNIYKVQSSSGTLISDYYTWIGASTAFVTTWYDQSSTQTNMVETDVTKQPEYINGGVLFNTDRLRADLTFNITDFTFIGKVDVNYGNAAGYFGIENTAGDVFDTLVNQEGSTGLRHGSNNSLRSYLSNEVVTGIHVISMHFAPNDQEMYLDGSLYASDTTHVPVTYTSGGAHFHMGYRHRNGSTGPLLNSRIFDVLYFPSVLDDTVRQQVNDCLQ